jgi:hypothetical protein
MAELSDKQRKNLKDSDFAEPEDRKYPIPDESHARNALSRVAQHGSEQEQKEVREKVEKKYPDLKQD